MNFIEKIITIDFWKDLLNDILSVLATHEYWMFYGGLVFYFIIVLIILSILFVIIALPLKPLINKMEIFVFNKDVENNKDIGSYLEYESKKQEYINFLLFFVFVFIVLSVINIIVVDQFNLLPPKLNTHIYNLSDDYKVKSLTLLSEKVENSIKNPKSITSYELREIFNETVKSIADVEKKIKQKNLEINTLKHHIKAEEEKVSEAREQTKKIKSITREQLETITLLITEDAKEESKKSFIYGIIISFPIGVLASFLASILFRRFAYMRKRIKN